MALRYRPRRSGAARKLRPGAELAKGGGREIEEEARAGGGEEKVALGSLESWEVAAAGFAPPRVCV